MKRKEKKEGFFNIVGGDFSQSGVASTQLKHIMHSMGIDNDIIRRVSIATFEAEMNVIIYTPAGILKYEIENNTIKVMVQDMGPGIEDIDLAMKEGYSTAPDWVREMGWGAGMGLPNMKKNSDVFKIDSVPGEGTIVEMTTFIEKGGVK